MMRVAGGESMMRVAGDDAPATSSGTGPPKVFVLRHEKRDPTDPRFFTHLTEEGMMDAAKTVSDNLHDLGITKIYASPFLRVLQTVEPFARRKGLLVRVDYSLYEHPEPNDEPVTALPAEFYERFPIDAAFASTLDGKRIGGAFYTLVPIRPRRRGERRSLRTLPGVSLRPSLAFNPRHRRLSTPTDAFELHPDIALYGMTLTAHNADAAALRRRLQAFLKWVVENHGADERVLLATHQTSCHELMHLQSGVEIETLDVAMGSVFELDAEAALGGSS